MMNKKLILLMLILFFSSFVSTHSAGSTQATVLLIPVGAALTSLMIHSFVYPKHTSCTKLLSGLGILFTTSYIIHYAQ